MSGLPGNVAPMLATSGPVPEGDGWAYEFKWDGVRAVTAVAGGELRMQSRNDKPLADMYPELGVIRDLVDRAVTLDGEIVALDDQARPDFGLLQQRMHRHHPPADLLAEVPVLYYVFDVLHLDGDDLTRLPYSDRRDALSGLDLDSAAVKVPPWFVGVEGATVQATAAQHGLEGVVAKRTGSRYEPGKPPLGRTRDRRRGRVPLGITGRQAAPPVMARDPGRQVPRRPLTRSGRQVSP